MKVVVARNAYEAVLVNPDSASFAASTSGSPRDHVIPLSSVAGASRTPSGARQSQGLTAQ
jgi:hypothetical protein